MYKLKRVYICDRCGKVELPEYDMSGVVLMPDGWRKLGREHLCYRCSRVYTILKDAVDKEK